jgi:hypothetical protein
MEFDSGTRLSRDERARIWAEAFERYVLWLWERGRIRVSTSSEVRGHLTTV